MVRDGRDFLEMGAFRTMFRWYELAVDIRQLFLLFGRCNLAESLVAQFAFLVLGEN
jgi:hypothetical protein